MKKSEKYNQSGCLDLTPYTAIKHIESEEKRLKKLLATIFYIIDIAGYTVEDRIILKDKRTGKVWR